MVHRFHTAEHRTAVICILGVPTISITYPESEHASDPRRIIDFAASPVQWTS
jgi:hypothetical protein